MNENILPERASGRKVTRRSFLTGLGAVALAAAVPLLAATPGVTEARRLKQLLGVGPATSAEERVKRLRAHLSHVTVAVRSEASGSMACTATDPKYPELRSAVVLHQPGVSAYDQVRFLAMADQQHRGTERVEIYIQSARNRPTGSARSMQRQRYGHSFAEEYLRS